LGELFSCPLDAQSDCLVMGPEHILVLPLVGKSVQEAYRVLQQNLSQIAAVYQTSAVSEIPYDGITNNGFIPEGDTKAMTIHQLDADEKFLKTFNMKMVAGEYFSIDRPSLKDGYVINETLAKTLGWTNALGKNNNQEWRS
jgi:putative ABC transport system permease protein